MQVCICPHTSSFSILVNTKSSVKRFQFAKVFWDYATEGDLGDVAEKSAASLRKLPFTSAGPDHMVKVASPSQKMHDCSIKKPERAELLHHTRFPSTPTKCRAQGKHAHLYVRKSRSMF